MSGSVAGASASGSTRADQHPYNKGSHPIAEVMAAPTPGAQDNHRKAETRMTKISKALAAAALTLSAATFPAAAQTWTSQHFGNNYTLTDPKDNTWTGQNFGNHGYLTDPHGETWIGSRSGNTQTWTDPLGQAWTGHRFGNMETFIDPRGNVITCNTVGSMKTCD